MWKEAVCLIREGFSAFKSVELTDFQFTDLDREVWHDGIPVLEFPSL